MKSWTPLDAAVWTMGQLAWPALLLGATIVTASLATRDKRLFFFLSSLALSEALLFAAGVFERQLTGTGTGWVTVPFLASQVGLLGSCALLSKSGRTALFLATICFIYAVLASFVAAMGFSGDWL